MASYQGFIRFFSEGNLGRLIFFFFLGIGGADAVASGDRDGVCRRRGALRADLQRREIQ